MIKKEVRVADIFSKHANGIADLVAQACYFESDIHLLWDNKNINAKSIMGVIAFSAEAGEMVTITAEGKDAEDAVEKMAEFLS